MLARPLVVALAQHARLTISGPQWCSALFGDLGTIVDRSHVPRRADAAVLVKPAFRAAWQARHLPMRIGWPTDHRRLLLTHVVHAPGPHRLHNIAALGQPLGVAVVDLPALPTVPAGAPGVVLLPLSASGSTVEWPGFAPLADALCARGHRVVFGAGPGESARLAQVAGPHPMLPELDIPAMAQVLAAADGVVGNDSGLTHLAAAARRGSGRDPGAVVGVVGSTDPARTGAPGVRWQVGPRPPCAPCYDKVCHRDLRCLDVPVQTVLADVCAVLEGRG